MNTVLLKTMIYTYLKTLTNEVYYGDKPEQASTYPYVIFNLDTSSIDDNQVLEQFELSVTVYDNSQFDTNTIDKLAGSIDGDGAMVGATGLHRKHYRSSTLTADIYRTSRDEFFDQSESNIIYIELLYDVYAYLS